MKEFTIMKCNNRYEVLTKDGFQDFDGVKKSIRNEGFKITFTNGNSITCTPEHKLLKGDIFVYAEDLRVGDHVTTENQKFNTISYIKEVKEKKEYFDLINVSNGNHYISSGVTSHNCAFIRPNIWAEFSDAIFPSQSGLAWKKNIIISTMNGMNHFYDLVDGARSDSNGFEITDVDWKVVPRYRPDGTLMPSDEFQSKIIKKYGTVYFEQNYANSAIGSSHTLINAEPLKLMKPQEPEEIRDGKLNIYKYPVKGHKYMCSVDPCKDGIDNFSVQIIDITTFQFEQVASASIQIEYLLMPEFLNEWCEFYNNPYLIIENNEGAGQSIADQMYQTYEYENLHFDKGLNNKRKKYPGFRTTTKTRRQILQTLKLFIDNDKLEVIDRTTIDEFRRFILINNKYQADEGCHDDSVMALALAFVPFCNSKNFEDMKKLIRNLYSDVETSDESESNFVDYLTIGDFDDGSDEDFEDYEYFEDDEKSFNIDGENYNLTNL